jgi:hypothetical protein
MGKRTKAEAVPPASSPSKKKKTKKVKTEDDVVPMAVSVSSSEIMVDLLKGKFVKDEDAVAGDTDASGGTPPIAPSSEKKKTKKVKTEAEADLRLTVQSFVMMVDQKGSCTKEEEDAATDSAAVHVAESLPFKLNKYHKRALSVLLFCHHNDNQSVTYNELSQAMDVGEKTKDWQCVAWKDLKTNNYIVPSPRKAGKSGETTYTLSRGGVELAATFATAKELADFRPALTNEEHHERIMSKLIRQHPKGKAYGSRIFDVLVATKDQLPMTKHELAAKLGTVADAHGFFYGFKGRLIVRLTSIFVRALPVVLLIW